MNLAEDRDNNDSDTSQSARRVIFRWILIALLVSVLTTQLCSRLGTYQLLPNYAEADVLSRYEADYGPWPTESLNIDLGGLATAVVDPDQGSSGSAATLTPTATSMFEPSPTPSSTPSLAALDTPVPTNTLISTPDPTNTRQPFVASSTPSRPTNTPVPTSPPPTNTPVPTSPPPTNTPVPTPTNTPVPSPTPTPESGLFTMPPP